MFGRKTKVDSGLRWYEFGRLTKSKLDTNTAIVSALVESHPHFAFDRDGSLAKHSAIVIKLGAERSAADHFALLECLNTSVISFFLQEVCHNKGSGGGSSKNERWTDFFEFNGSNLGDIPIPPRISGELAERIDKSARDRGSLLSNLDAVDDVPLTRILQLRSSQDHELSGRMISLQEELDWKGLIAYGLAPDDLRVLGADAPPLSLGHRAFEIVLARQVAAGEIEPTWFERHGSTPVTDIPRDWPTEYRKAVEQRVALIESDADVALIERPEHKRRWSGASWDDRQRGALAEMVLDGLEEPSLWEDLRLRSTNELTDKIRSQARHLEALEMLAERKDADLAATLQRLVIGSGGPKPLSGAPHGKRTR